MTINLQVPPQPIEGLKPNITVIGVGGAGGNAVNNMIKANLEGANFVVANTDAQALEYALTDSRIQLGNNVTQGLGAGAIPEVGHAAAEEAVEELESCIRGSNMVFITAGMGGGTGTGAAPVIARLAREMGILTVGVVTKPFHFEGTHRMRIADHGLSELQKFVDTLIVIPNQNLFRIANEKTTFADAFAMADNVLHSGVRGITDLMTMPGLINLDFADIRAVMSEMGKAMMGTGEAEGERRAVDAAEAAISNPLLDDVSMKGARGVLINVTGGNDLTLFEVDEAANRIRDEVDSEANIIFGAIFDENMEGRMRVSVVATGVDMEEYANNTPQQRSVAAQPNVQSRPVPVSSGASASSVHHNSAAASASARNQANDKQRGFFSAVKTNGTVSATSPSEFTLKKKADFAPKPQKSKEEPKVSEYEKENPQMSLSVAEASDESASHSSDMPAGKVEGDSFIPPRPTEASRSVEPVSYRRVPEARPVQENANMTEEDQESNGFFQRVGRAFTSRIAMDDDEEISVRKASPKVEVKNEKPKPEVRMASSSAASSKEDDHLDIPAFLRRQAN